LICAPRRQQKVMVDGSDLIWTALGLVFVIEGLMPFISPSGWRRIFMQVQQLTDGQIRFFWLCLHRFGLAALGLDVLISGPLWGPLVTG